MKIVLQRVSDANIVVNGGTPQGIQQGLVALVGFGQGDTEDTVDYMLEKTVNLRIFNDEQGYFNYSLMDVKGELLVVSNFTLYANSKRGRRPSFTDAAHPDQAVPLYDYFLQQLDSTSVPWISGEFGADMQINLTNDGPVTIILDSDELMPKSKGESS